MESLKRDYVVYKHTAPNGKCYIGITGQNPPEKRWANGRGYVLNKCFDNEIMLYGWDNFKHEILFGDLTKTEAQQKEIELIAYYKSNQEIYGYNVSSGGACIGTHSEESKKKMSEHAHEKSCVRQFDKAGNFIKEYESIKRASIETGITRQNIVACCNNRVRMAGGFIWRYELDELTAEHIDWCNNLKKKMVRQVQKQKQTKEEVFELRKNRGKPVVQYTFFGDVVGKFENLTIAGEKTGISKSNISQCCKGKTGSAGGYIWKYEGDAFADFGSNGYNYKTNKPIIQYATNGVLIRQYNSIIEAATINNIDQSSITKCCKGKQKTAGNFIWRYTSDIQDPTAPLFPTSTPSSSLSEAV